MSRPTVAIIGAGVAGLTAALAFARRGAAVTVFEQSAEISAVGAGLQLSPNATRILEALGVLGALERLWLEPSEVTLVSGTGLSTLASVPVGAQARRRWGAPYGVLHRADLQNTLLSAVDGQADIKVRLGTPIGRPRAAAMPSPATLKAELAGHLGHDPDLIVAADGVWSGLRRLVAGHGRARFSGYVAWRMTVAADAAACVNGNATTAFLGPSTHLVAYPLARSGRVNLVAVTRGRNPGETWQTSVEAAASDTLERAFAAWHPTIRKLLAQTRERTVWPLFEVEDGAWVGQALSIGTGSSGGSGVIGPVLIGDAAHAMMPFAAQGAAAAIEDGFELAAACLSEGGAINPAAVGRYAERRRARIARLRARAAFNRLAYHARGPLRIGRNLVLAMRQPESLAADLDWLYGYRSPGLDAPE